MLFQKKLYTFTTTYKVEDMSVTSLRKIFQAMTSEESDEGQQYCNNYVVSELDKACTLKMRADVYCAGELEDLYINMNTSN